MGAVTTVAGRMGERGRSGLLPPVGVGVLRLDFIRKADGLVGMAVIQ